MNNHITEKSKADTAAVGKRILVVDDDYYFRTLLEKSLTRLNHIPTCAENAKQAQQMIALDDFDLVISDIQMPQMSGIQLLHWIKANHSIPVILMTGFSEIAETHEAVELGANGFLAKPFKTEELLQAIAGCFLEHDESEEPQNLDPLFCKVSIDDFVSGKEMKYDIHVRISEKKYIKIAHGGEDLPQDRIKSYKDKNIHFLYMGKEDFKRYLDFNLTLAQLVTNSDKISHLKKVNFIKHASEVVLQNLFLNEIKPEDFQQASALVENAVALISDNQDAAALLIALAQQSDFLYAHSVGVSFYASLIGRTLGWKSSATIFKLSVGGLLHDIGKKEIPRAILEKPRKDLTADEVLLLETHPFRGAEILSQLQCIPTDILQIIHEHHENCLGFGYPSHLKKNKIHPLARVVALANEFCNYVIKNPNSPGLSPAEAIQRICGLNPEYYDDAALRALQKIFKLEHHEFASLQSKDGNRKAS